jgi:hypothetical protein
MSLFVGIFAIECAIWLRQEIVMRSFREPVAGLVTYHNLEDRTRHAAAGVVAQPSPFTP